LSAGQQGVLRSEVLCGFDPLEKVLQALAVHFGAVARFYVDRHGGAVIGIKWQADAFVPAPFRVATAHLSRPSLSHSAGAVTVVPDVPAILHDLNSIGSGMFADVILNC
jgi:U3 small nucleolar RNA-associated protein 22